MSKIVIHRGNRERIINLADVQVFRADCKNVVVSYGGEEWFVKYPSSPTLKALHAISDGIHIHAGRWALIAVSDIVGRIKDYEKPGRFAAVMRDGSIVKIARREQAAFNRIYRWLDQ
jgi:DUF917 family protein